MMIPKKLRCSSLLTVGVVLCACGLGLILLGETAAPVSAQDEEPYYVDADYLGADECSACHRNEVRAHTETFHALTLAEPGRRGEGVLADFEAGAEVRTMQFPEEDAPRAFELDDVAFILGAGRSKQAYVYEEDRRDYRVLPAQWNVAAGEWEPLELAASWDDPAYDFETACAACHTTGFDAEDLDWEDIGVTCESCHGPGGEHEEVARDEGRNPDEEGLARIAAVIASGADSQACGQCHSRATGPDGQPYAAGYRPGMTLSDMFTQAEFAGETDVHWWESGHGRQINMQYTEWALSAHAGTTDDGSEVAGCTACHDPHSEEGRPANLIADSDALCVTCHTSSAGGRPSKEMYEGAPVVDTVLPLIGVHFAVEDGPTCTSCHMPQIPVEGGTRTSHLFEPVLAFGVEGLPDACSDCHGTQAEPALIEQLINDVQDSTRERLDAARALVTPTTPEWIVEALDFVENDGSLGMHNYAYADALLDAVYEALGLYDTDTAAVTPASGAGQ
ncbi:MAG: ammonia-forming cytochrome c nitrite reductase subunit c552 [Chloroflexi bacterium]|nr:ammonia-forming cytochrome c nitrite reductase subunit c552 [Chloroflexota bacterium]